MAPFAGAASAAPLGGYTYLFRLLAIVSGSVVFPVPWKQPVGTNRSAVLSS